MTTNNALENNLHSNVAELTQKELIQRIPFISGNFKKRLSYTYQRKISGDLI